MLISSGARINETQNVSYEMFLLKMILISMKFKIKNGDTALHVAARCGFLDTFDRLIEEGAKPELINNDGENVLHISVKECHFPIVNKIINYVHKKKRTPASDGQETTSTEEYDPVKELINQQNKVFIIKIVYFLNKCSSNFFNLRTKRHVFILQLRSFNLKHIMNSNKLKLCNFYSSQVEMFI